MNAFLPLFRRAVTGAAGRRLQSLISNRSGAAAVTIAISFTGIAGLAGLGTEAANWYLTERAIQGATDAAAHTGATALMNATTSAAAKTEAKSVAANFGFSSGSGATVTVNNPPASGSHSGDNSAVEVIISQPMTLMLSGLFVSTAPTISARSVALKPTQTFPPCVMTLDTASETSLSTSGTPALNLTGCSLYVDSKGAGALTMNGGTISASGAYVAGTVSGTGLTANPTKTGVNPHSDPYGSVSAPAYSGCAQTNYKVTGNSTPPPISPAPGTAYVFCNGLQVLGGSTLNLCPGTYVIDQGTVDIKGGGTVNAPPSTGCSTSGGVTIFLTNHTTSGSPADISFAANSVVNITAPTSGSLSGLALFQDRVACSSCSNSLGGGSTQNITGAIYFPKNTVTYNGGASTGGAVCTQLIANKLTFSGNSNLSSTCGSAGTATINVTSSQLVE